MSKKNSHPLGDTIVETVLRAWKKMAAAEEKYKDSHSSLRVSMGQHRGRLKKELEELRERYKRSGAIGATGFMNEDEELE